MCVREQTALRYVFRSCKAMSGAPTEQAVMAHDERASNLSGFWLYPCRAPVWWWMMYSSGNTTHQLANFKDAMVKMQRD